MPRKAQRFAKRYIATLDDVTIRRDGDSAVIAYHEPDIATTHLTIGPEIEGMTLEEIVEIHNDCLRAQAASAVVNARPLIEVPLGKRQIQEHLGFHTPWSPRGDILRCQITAGEDDLPAVIIDDLEFSWEEFGQLWRSRMGWGLRIAIVEEDELHEQPEIVVEDPVR